MNFDLYERELVWIVMLYPERFHDIGKPFGEEYFHDGTCRIAWRVIAALAARGATISDLIVRAEIKSMGLLAQVDEMTLIPEQVDPDALEDRVARLRERQLGERWKTALLNHAAQRSAGDAERHACIRELTAIAGEASPGDDGEVSEFLDGHVAQIEADRIAPNRRGVSFGLAPLDDRTGGMLGGELVIVAGRPGSGKSALLFHVADSLASADLPVLLFTLEMPKGEVVDRMLSARASINGAKFRDRRALSLADMEGIRQASDALRRTPLRMFDGGFDVHGIEAVCRREHRRFGRLGAIAIDYLGKIKLGAKGKSRRDTLAQEIGEQTNALHRLAIDLDCPVILGAQLNRDSDKDKRPPTISDLRDSGSIEQDGNLILLLHRERLDDGSLSEDAKIIVGKHRQGRTGKVEARFRGEYSRFEIATRERSAPAHFSEPNTEDVWRPS